MKKLLASSRSARVSRYAHSKYVIERGVASKTRSRLHNSAFASGRRIENHRRFPDSASPPSVTFLARMSRKAVPAGNSGKNGSSGGRRRRVRHHCANRRRATPGGRFRRRIRSVNARSCKKRVALSWCFIEVIMDFPAILSRSATAHRAKLM